jgi:signal transduction histidine kinase
VATRSFVWVPVMQGENVTALLSVQSYRPGAFGSWHVHLLEDVAAHVSLALANAGHYAAAQEERRRLEALHVLEMGVAGSADEREIAEAVFTAFRSYLEASHYVLAYLDAQGRLTGFGSEDGRPIERLAPQSVDRTHFFRRLAETGTPIVEPVPEHLREPLSGLGWATADHRFPQHAIWVPVFQGDRVVGALSAQRFEDEPFGASQVQLLQGAAPVVGIALRSVRLHRSHERALARSVHIQEVAALAGHEIGGVVASVAEQARAMLDAAGVACWAFDSEGRVTAQAAAGSELAMRVLGWSGHDPGGNWAEPPRELLAGSRRSVSWTLIPLWSADRMVGALGYVNPASGLEDPGTAPLEFARHAAIAIENSRLVAETRGRIHTLEAVAAFTDLDITRPEATRAEMGLLVERVLAGSSGALWLLDGEHLVRPGGSGTGADLVEVGDSSWLARALRGDGYRRRLRDLLRELSGGGEQTVATPIRSGGRLLGILVAQGGGSDPSEVRRQMAVLAGQAALVLARLDLVDALDHERQMMNAILRNSPVGVMLLDTGGRVVYANDGIENIYRLTPESLLNRTEADVLAEAGATPRLDEDRSAASPVELRLSEPERVVQVRRVSIPGSAGQAAGELTLHEDVTEERQLMEAKDLMLRAIGHEVLSPATAMRTTLAGLLQWDPRIQAPDRQRLVEEAYEMSERLLNLVESQLVIAKLETRRFEPNPSSVVLSGALAEVLAVLQHRYGSRIAQVAVRLPDHSPVALCEATHLEQVLTNLIGNALEYTRDAVEVGARQREGWLEIFVADQGGGLPSDRRDYVFQKPGPAGQNRARGGLGLGLYLCRLVVERSFGGRIWVERTGSTGTVFKFTVPAAPGRSGSSDEAAVAEAQAG